MCALWVAGLGAGCATGALGPEAAASVDARPTSAELEAGLREALHLAVERTGVRTARRGGFAGDPQLRIEVPEDLLGPASALREAGMGWAVDEFEASMNRAAEASAAGALPLLDAAVDALALEDAEALLEREDAALALRLREGAGLREGMVPIAAGALAEAEVESRYLDLSARLATLQLHEDPRFELDAYVLDRTLEGLFAVLAQEELRIREEPPARTTELLRRVFESR